MSCPHSELVSVYIMVNANVNFASVFDFQQNFSHKFGVNILNASSAPVMILTGLICLKILTHFLSHACYFTHVSTRTVYQDIHLNQNINIMSSIIVSFIPCKRIVFEPLAVHQ
jgi:hypothetical protein